MVNSKHTKLASQLRQRIESGDLQPGDQVPTEVQLVEQTGLSRDTIRRALTSLREEGLIEPGPGHTRIVKTRALVQIYASKSETRGQREEYPGVDAFTADIRAQGMVPGQKITITIETDASPKITKRLGVEPGTKLVARSRVRTVNDRPHDIDTSFYRRDLVNGTAIESPDDLPQGVVKYMADKMGIVQVRYVDDVEVRMATRGETEVLGLNAVVPVLVRYRTSYDAAGTPIRVTHTVYAGDRTMLTWELPAS